MGLKTEGRANQILTWELSHSTWVEPTSCHMTCSIQSPLTEPHISGPRMMTLIHYCGFRLHVRLFLLEIFVMVIICSGGLSFLPYSRVTTHSLIRWKWGPGLRTAHLLVQPGPSSVKMGCTFRWAGAHR